MKLKMAAYLFYGARSIDVSESVERELDFEVLEYIAEVLANGSHDPAVPERLVEVMSQVSGGHRLSNPHAVIWHDEMGSVVKVCGNGYVVDIFEPGKRAAYIRGVVEHLRNAQ